MSPDRSFLTATAGLLGLAVAAALLWTTGARAAPTLKLIECQHPVVTGEEVYNLHNITAKMACPVVLDLGHWEYEKGHAVQHITELYTCGGLDKRYPKLKLRSFEGRRLSLTKAGDFQMSLGGSSFDVTGTDFPLNCS